MAFGYHHQINFPIRIDFGEAPGLPRHFSLSSYGIRFVLTRFGHRLPVLSKNADVDGSNVNLVDQDASHPKPP